MTGHVLDITGSARARSMTRAAPVATMPSTVIGTAGAGAAALTAGGRSLVALDGVRIGTTPDAAFAAGVAESGRAAWVLFWASSRPPRSRTAGAPSWATRRGSSV